jgi:hypothetical protein
MLHLQADELKQVESPPRPEFHSVISTGSSAVNTSFISIAKLIGSFFLKRDALKTILEKKTHL